MKQLEDTLVTITEEHKCPHEGKILGKKFKCDNLKKKSKEYFCYVCKCPYDGALYSQKEIRVRNGT